MPGHASFEEEEKGAKKPYCSLLFEIDLGGWFSSAQLTSPKSAHSRLSLSLIRAHVIENV